MSEHADQEPNGADKQPAPFVEIVKGAPNAEEIAAIVAVLGGALSQGPSAGVGNRPPRDGWGPTRERMQPQYFNGVNAYTSQTPLFWTRGT